jgi:hypothetical protein
MPGSAANPVVLDPFRTIVEVGWNPATHVAFPIDYRATLYYTYSADPCDPPEFSESSGPAHWTEYLTQIVYSGPPTPPSGGYALRKGEWGIATDIEISGVPSPGSTGSYGPWEKATVRNVLQDDKEHIGGSVPGDLEWKIENARAGHFTPASGTGTGISIPVGEGEFQTGFTPEFATLTQLYLGPDPVCFTDGSLKSTARLLQAAPLTRINPFDVPASSFHATWRGKTYTGMAAFVASSSGGSGWLPEAPTEVGDGVVWILCIRDDLVP